MKCGVWSAKSGVRSAECEVWSAKCGVQSVEWRVESGEVEAWTVKCGEFGACGVRSVKSVERGARNVKNRVWISECRACHVAYDARSMECEGLAATACV